MLELTSIFLAVFLAELGDKTQLATMLFATDGDRNPWAVFGASAAALTLSSAIAVLLGAFAGKYMAMIPLKPIAGVGFVVIGAWTLFDHFKGA
ncbi:MAG: TMEM165/GDT1 family protein [Alphaproteobacteria bacterium]|nr:TMEM165/GDT1 family protein [Alphaproteobacteria bacterium]